MLKARRISIGSWAVLVVLALGFLFSLGPFANAAPKPAMPSLGWKDTSLQVGKLETLKLSNVPPSNPMAPFDCSQIAQLGLEKQMNFRAATLLADCRGTKSPDQSGPVMPAAPLESLLPGDYGGVDQNVILPDHPIYPKVTQSETMVWGHGDTIVINYNDSRNSPGCYAGLSYSTDGGVSWTRAGGKGASPSPLCSGHGTNFGDPILVWNNALNMWFAGDMATECGGQGIGLWTSTDGITWTPGACAHNGASDDRPSMWVDNNPSSAYYGRMYISWNNYASGQNIYVTWSDNGTTWSTPVRVQSGGFIRNVQITGSPGTDGTIFIAGMNEGGGAANNRTNIMYRSTNGGTAWTAVTVGSPFAPPGDGPCAGSAYFRMVIPIWRHMGWGQPAVGPNGVVHYAYAVAGASADHGDIMYVHSTDNGLTWSTPFRMNTDTTERTQWLPSLAVTSEGVLVVSWYDRRNTSNNNYEWYGRISTDNGITWGLDQVISDQIIPQPLQPDAAVQPCYAGDYNYHSTDGTNAYLTWTDGRTLINGNSQQDVYFDKISFASPTPTPELTPCVPTCISTPTWTPSGTATYTPTNTRTATPTATFTSPPTGTNTRTATPATFTGTATSTTTFTLANTVTGTRTSTSTHTPALTATVTPCTMNFADVHASDYYYEAVRYLYCRGVISGYGDDTFRPGSLTTRGQLCKIVVLAEGWPIYLPGTPTFQDVPTYNTFYQYIETAYHQGIVSGYSCGLDCLEFRSGDNMTRGQLCKIVVLAEGWTLADPPAPTFRDVPAIDAFYMHIETAYNHNIISGYSCGAGCLEFRPGSNATRGQICKIAYSAVTQP